MTDLELVKQLRQITQVGFSDCKSALEESDWNLDKAIEILRKKGIAKAGKKAGNKTLEGVVASYIHSGNGLGAMVQLGCQTDFVARNEDFVKLAQEIAMHVAAMNPEFVSRDQVPQERLDKEKEIILAQSGDLSKKPKEVQEKIVEGKLSKFFEEICLMNQKFVKDDSKTIEEIIKESIAKVGENIQIVRFARFSVK